MEISPINSPKNTPVSMAAVDGANFPTAVRFLYVATPHGTGIADLYGTVRTFSTQGATVTMNVNGYVVANKYAEDEHLHADQPGGTAGCWRRRKAT